MNATNALNALLARHFAPLPLEELVVTRRDFAHWMRPDLQKALEALFAALPGCRFTGGRVRSRDFDFRFADLVEARTKAIVAAPAVYQDVDVGEEKPVRCLTRGLWLAQRDGVAFALLLDVTEYYGRVRARLEIAVAAGEASAQLAAEVLAQLVREAEGGASWRGKMLVLKPADDDYDIAPPGPQVEKAARVRREDIVLPEATLALIERNTILFAQCADQLVRLGLSGKKGVLLYGPPGTGKTTVVRWLAGELTAYLAEVERLATIDPAPGTADGDRLELLAKLVEDYERERFALPRLPRQPPGALLTKCATGGQMLFKRITVDPKQMGGMPCIRGMRIPVASVLGMLADGMTERQILDAYPDLQAEDVQEALRYAAEAVENVSSRLGEVPRR